MFSKLVTLAAVFSAVVVEANVSSSSQQCDKKKNEKPCCILNGEQKWLTEMATTCTEAGGKVDCCVKERRRSKEDSTDCMGNCEGRRLEMRLGELAAVHEVEEADEEDRRREVSSSTQGCDPKRNDDSGRNLDCEHLPGKPNCLETSRDTLSKLCPDSMCMDDLKFTCQA